MKSEVIFRIYLAYGKDVVFKGFMGIFLVFSCLYSQVFVLFFSGIFTFRFPLIGFYFLYVSLEVFELSLCFV